MFQLEKQKIQGNEYVNTSVDIIFSYKNLNT